MSLFKRPDKLVANHWIRGVASWEEYPYNGPPRIIFRAANSEQILLTPDEAKRMAEILLAEAEHSLSQK